MGFQSLLLRVVLLAVALLYVVYRLTEGSFSPLDVLVGCAPLVFAAAVVQAAPTDRRFTGGALALAAGPALRLAAALIPGAWLAAAPALLDVSHIALELAKVLLLVGLTLIGVALGGVRSAFGVVVVGTGVLVGLATVAWALGHPLADLPTFDLGRSIAIATLSALAWAFLLGAAIDGLRSLMITGAGLLFAIVVIEAALLWWPAGPGANFDLLSLVVGGISLAGWAALIAAALRDELSAARVGAARLPASRKPGRRVARGR